jgi:hypothetical protein
LLWCSEVRSNEWRFFNRPGVDPELGVLVKPVTVNLRSQWDRVRNVISKTQQELEHATALLAQESSARGKLATTLAAEQSRIDSLQKQAARDKETALREASARIEAEANMRQLRAELAAAQTSALTLENCLVQTNTALQPPGPASFRSVMRCAMPSRPVKQRSWKSGNSPNVRTPSAGRRTAPSMSYSRSALKRNHSPRHFKRLRQEPRRREPPWQPASLSLPLCL